jgi:hypothetical protein
MIAAFFGWWYGAGWRLVATKMRRQIKHTEAQFSVGTLLGTLFQPWRRIISYPGNGLDAHVRAMVDNLISRFVGAMIRLGVLLAAGVILLLTLVFGGLAIVLWPLVLPASLVFIILGLI